MTDISPPYQYTPMQRCQSGLGLDYTIIDRHYDGLELADIEHHAGGHSVSPGAKLMPDVARPLIKALNPFLARLQPRESVGGSTANSMVNVGNFLRQYAKGDFAFHLLTGCNRDGTIIESIMQEYQTAGIYVPDDLAQKDAAENIILNILGHDRLILKHKAGNINRLVTVDWLEAQSCFHPQYGYETIQPSDAAPPADFFFLQGGGWTKYSPAVMDYLVSLRWDSVIRQTQENQHIPLILALPTGYPDRIKDPEIYYQETERFKFLISSADYLLSNMEELVMLFGTELVQHFEPASANLPDGKSIIDYYPKRLSEIGAAQMKEAIEEAALGFLRNHLEKGHKAMLVEYPNIDLAPPVVFITNDKEGAILLVADHEGQYQTLRIGAKPREGILHKTGAGDAAYGGFILGLLLGQPPVEAANLAMKVAYHKLGIEEARIAFGEPIIDPTEQTLLNDIIAKAQQRAQASMGGATAVA